MSQTDPEMQRFEALLEKVVQTTSHTDKRLQSLEAIVQETVANQAATTANLNHLAKTVRTIDDRSSTKNYAPVSIGVTLGLATIAGFFSIILGNQDAGQADLKARVEKIEDTQGAMREDRFTGIDGSELAAETRAEHDRLDRADIALEKEMRLLLRELESAMRSEHVRLTAEKVAGDHELTIAVSELRNWMLEHDAAVGAINAKQDTRIAQGDVDHINHTQRTSELENRLRLAEIELATRAAAIEHVQSTLVTPDQP